MFKKCPFCQSMTWIGLQTSSHKACGRGFGREFRIETYEMRNIVCIVAALLSTILFFGIMKFGPPWGIKFLGIWLIIVIYSYFGISRSRMVIKLLKSTEVSDCFISGSGGIHITD